MVAKPTKHGAVLQVNMFSFAKIVVAPTPNGSVGNPGDDAAPAKPSAPFCGSSKECAEGKASAPGMSVRFWSHRR